MPDPNEFTIRREEVRNGVDLSFVHEGAGARAGGRVPILRSTRPSAGAPGSRRCTATGSGPRPGTPAPTTSLYGEDDHVVDRTFPDRCRVAFPECIGPFVLRHCGHFVQWEAADTLNTPLRWFCADLLV